MYCASLKWCRILLRRLVARQLSPNPDSLAMDSVDRTSRRRTADLTYKPETGLAEWTSKIKALQRQVDQDEEDETRRIEQEIAASRLARLRRSTGGASRNTSLDLCKMYLFPLFA